jgi:hypothetical protein
MMTGTETYDEYVSEITDTDTFEIPDLAPGQQLLGTLRDILAAWGVPLAAPAAHH